MSIIIINVSIVISRLLVLVLLSGPSTHFHLILNPLSQVSVYFKQIIWKSRNINWSFVPDYRVRRNLRPKSSAREPVERSWQYENISQAPRELMLRRALGARLKWALAKGHCAVASSAALRGHWIPALSWKVWSPQKTTFAISKSPTAKILHFSVHLLQKGKHFSTTYPVLLWGKNLCCSTTTQISICSYRCACSSAYCFYC